MNIVATQKVLGAQAIATTILFDSVSSLVSRTPSIRHEHERASTSPVWPTTFALRAFPMPIYTAPPHWSPHAQANPGRARRRRLTSYLALPAGSPQACKAQRKHNRAFPVAAPRTQHSTKTQSQPRRPKRRKPDITVAFLRCGARPSPRQRQPECAQGLEARSLSRPPMYARRLLAALTVWAHAAHTARAEVTVYGVAGPVQQTLDAGASGSASAASATYTPPAFNSVVLQAPAVPQPAPPTQFGLTMQQSAQGVANLSIAQSGAFYGFSIEFSVVTQVIGINASFINVPFLNLMSIISQRAGRVHIRVGGNTQETATLVESLADGKALEKDKTDTTNPTDTPALLFTPEIIYMFANVSALVNTKWYLGIPFNDTNNLRLGIAEVGEAVLGDNILGFQAANEPDLYASHQHRPPNYTQWDYFGEFGVLIQGIGNDDSIPVKNNLIAPSIATGAWTPEMVWDTGFVGAYTNSLGALSVEHYPDDNCAAAFPDAGFGPPKDPQTVFPNYLNHTSGIDIIGLYLNSTNFAQQNGKPFLMMETNTASCGGFPGISDSFGAALWALDYGLQMAYSNFSGALLHVGGVSDTYNPFTPPPTNMSTFSQWTIGPVYYAAVIVAEAFGSSNASQIVDLFANDNNIFTPAYGIYENGNLARVALFNYVTDPSGASTYTASISVANGAVPSQVSVKYLLAPSVAEKTNITWTGQTLSGVFQSDGRFKGDENVVTVPCDQGSNTCSVQVPAPGFALVFMSDDAFSESNPSTTVTYSTTAVTKSEGTATIPSAVLATSNGQSGSERQKLGSTSKGKNAAAHTAIMPSLAALYTIFVGAAAVLSAL